ncbi:MAG TPA: hypothetical protein PKE63_12200 [Lacibacter sp.]|nr:hypothetical protein [Lacibacter sp.]HMO87991.1 hypothetical protein [Lacibacter sp.]HMP88031.1 hypothetical protein [Lacibacter sp.]
MKKRHLHIALHISFLLLFGVWLVMFALDLPRLMAAANRTDLFRDIVRLALFSTITYWNVKRLRSLLRPPAAVQEDRPNEPVG